MIADFKVLSDIPRNDCPECFTWNSKALTLLVVAKEMLADKSVKFWLKYTDDFGKDSEFYFYVDVDPL